jgi:rare lipoprotein A
MRTAVLVPLAALGALSLAGWALGQDAGSPVVFQEEGQASYYGEGFDGRPTAKGEPFDKNAMTAAHPKLPLNAGCSNIARQELEPQSLGQHATVFC